MVLVRIDHLPALRSPLARLALVTAAFGVLLGVVYYVTVRTVPGRELGDASLRGALATNSLLADSVDAVLDVVSVASLLAAVAVVAVIALVRLERLTGLAAIGLLAGSNASTWLLKEVLLTRPDLGVSEYTPATLNSMPSGHSTAVFSGVAALLFVLPRPWRPALATAGAGYATLTALATMSAGWHRSSDSVAAFLVVGLWTAAAAAAVVVAQAGTTAAPGQAPPPLQPSVRRLAPVAAALIGLGIVVAVALTAAPSLRDSALGQSAALLSSALLVAGTALGVLVAVVRALDLMETVSTRG